MGNTNKPASTQDLLQYIDREVRKWNEILGNISGPRIDWNVMGPYIEQEMNTTEQYWRKIRQCAVSQTASDEILKYKDLLRKRVDELRGLESTNAQLEKRNQFLEKNYTSISRQTAEPEKEHDQLVRRLQCSSARADSSQSSNQKPISSGKVHMTEMDDKLQMLTANNESLKMHVTSIEEEKTALLLRLSKMAGDRLVYNNPAITDLSDPNRPTKLGEIYSEMYDNEWTNAFEALQNSGYDEETAIETLRMTLLNALQFCKQKSDMLVKQAADAVNLLFEEYKLSVSQMDVPAYLTIRKKQPRQRGNMIREQSTFDEEVQLQQRWKPKTPPHRAASSAQQTQQRSDIGHIKERLKSTAESKLIQLRKEVAISMVPIVQQAYVEASWDSDCLDALKPFIMECLHLGWMMAVQSPPMALDTCEPGDKFDKNMFKEYTSTGPVVSYAVWPALLLEKNGPVVAKGVAQGKKS